MKLVSKALFQKVSWHDIPFQIDGNMTFSKNSLYIFYNVTSCKTILENVSFIIDETVSDTSNVETSSSTFCVIQDTGSYIIDPINASKGL